MNKSLNNILKLNFDIIALEVLIEIFRHIHNQLLCSAIFLKKNYIFFILSKNKLNFISCKFYYEFKNILLLRKDFQKLVFWARSESISGIFKFAIYLVIEFLILFLSCTPSIIIIENVHTIAISINFNS